MIGRLIGYMTVSTSTLNFVQMKVIGIKFAEYGPVTKFAVV